jgi:hypothetical protein
MKLRLLTLIIILFSLAVAWYIANRVAPGALPKMEKEIAHEEPVR